MSAKIIFVLSEARTGSTLLCQLLAHYKNVINFHEIFHTGGEANPNYDIFNTSVSFNNILQHQFGDGVFDREKMFPRIIENPKKLVTLMGEYFNETLIVKVHLHQLFGTDYPVSHIFDWILMQPNHEFILLKRDFLKSHVSLLKAEQSGVWHNTDTTNIKVIVDLDRFKTESMNYIWKYDAVKQKLQHHNIDYLYIDYEKDLENYNITEFSKLVEPWSTRNSLGLNSAGNAWIRVEKQNTNDTISDSISNWPDVSALLTKYTMKQT
jgi:LPS sulfotransferase NodH